MERAASAASASASASAAAAFAASVSAADAAFAASAASAADAAFAASAASAAAAAATEIWESISRDANWLVSLVSTVETDEEFIQAALLAKKPLWLPDSPDEPGSGIRLPDWARETWDVFKVSRLVPESGFGIWVSWYEARLRGRSSGGFDPSLSSKAAEDLDVRVATQPEGFWDRAPAEVNAEIREWIEAAKESPAVHDENYADEETPPAEAPAQGPGPKYTIQDGQLDAVETLPEVDERSDATQQKLFERLKEQFARLSRETPRIRNEQPGLAQSIEDYARVVAVDELERLDVTDLWMVGAGLIEHARAFENQSPDATITPPLEPERLALLREVARLHAALVMGFEEGRALADRADLSTLDAATLRTLASAEGSVIRDLLDRSSLLLDRAKAQIEALDHLLMDGGVRAERAAQIAYPAVRNILIACAQVAKKAAIGGVALTSVGLADGMLIAWIEFLVANMSPILSVTATQPELNQYFEWLLRRLEDLRDEEDQS